jgi:hypothetical protein
MRIVDCPHIQERIELFARQVGNVVEAEGQGQADEAAPLQESLGVQNLTLQFEEEGVALQGVVEKKGEIVIGEGRHLGAARSPECDDGEWLVVPEGLSLFLRPIANQCGINRRSFRCDFPAATQIRTADPGIVLLDQLPERFPRAAAPDLGLHRLFQRFARHQGRSAGL